MCGSEFGARSLDEELGVGWSLVETIEDAGALEEMETATAAA